MRNPASSICLLTPDYIRRGCRKKPYDGVALHDSDGAIIVRYSRRPARAYFLEPNGRVVRIGQPKLVLLDGQFLNDRRQAIVAVPKTRNRPTFHRVEKACSDRRDTQPGPPGSPNRAGRRGRLPRSACPTRRQSDPGSIREDEKNLHEEVARWRPRSAPVCSRIQSNRVIGSSKLQTWPARPVSEACVGLG